MFIETVENELPTRGRGKNFAFAFISWEDDDPTPYKIYLRGWKLVTPTPDSDRVYQWMLSCPRGWWQSPSFLTLDEAVAYGNEEWEVELIR